MIKYGLDKKLFDTKLTRDRWSSSQFRFLAGDLYDVVPLLKQKYTPKEEVGGSCSVDMEWPYVEGSPGSHDPYVFGYFNFKSKCELKVK